MKKIVILLITLIVISIGILSGCTNTTKPNIIVSSFIARTGYEGIDYVLYIDVVVQNTGDASGEARVWSEVNQDSSHYEKTKDIYLGPGEIQSFIFKYTEFSFWSVDSGTYRVWIENK